MNNKKFFRINLIYFIAMILVASIFVLGYAGILTNDFVTSFLIQIVVMFAIPMLMYTALISKNFKKTFSDAGFKKISLKMVGIAILLGIVLYCINDFVASAFASFISLLGYENISTSTTVTFNYGLLLKDFILSCVLPGFCEEFLHRGIMLHAGKNCANTRFVLISSSILFGLMHLNINQFFYACILGFLMGYVSLASNSIFPAMIIHFMNNFLSSYFYYGYYLNWPLANFIYSIESALLSNIFIYVMVSTLFIIAMIFLYFYLTRLIAKERVRYEVLRIIDCLRLEKIPIEEAQQKINQTNEILEKTRIFNIKDRENKKFSFVSIIFLISSIALGSLITISSFIWGII